MKLKAVLKDGASEMKTAVESPKFRERVVGEVLVPFLKMKTDIGAAEFYIQKSDFAVGDDRHLCEVRLSGVSVSKNRATNDYYDARHGLEKIYAQTLYPLLQDGESLQLMVCLMLDRSPLGEETSLIERRGKPAVMIYGGRPLPKELDERI